MNNPQDILKRAAGALRVSAERAKEVGALDQEEQLLADAATLDSMARQERRLSQHPIPMILHCPACNTQHIDKAEPCSQCCNPDRDGCGLMDAGYRCIKWDNPPHRSHVCASCGHIWRPADVCTTGVERIETKGKNYITPVQPKTGEYDAE